MIKTLIKAYHTVFNKGKLAVIESFSEEENFFRNEVAFFDNGRVASGIERLKADYAAIEAEIKFVKQTGADDEDYEKKLNFLYKRQYECITTMAFQTSQNLKNIDACLALTKGLNYDFKLCLEGLRLYKDDDKEAAFAKFGEYLKRKKSFSVHYLLNKIYGEMLFNKGNYKAAEVFLYNVTQICPEDNNNHKLLATVYEKNGNVRQMKIEKEIVKVLGGAL